MKAPLAAILTSLVASWSLVGVPVARGAAPALTRSAVLHELAAQAVRFGLRRVVTVSAGERQTLTVAEGATAGVSPLCRFFFWHDATFVGQIEGWDARIASWRANRITLSFGDVPGSPQGYTISYSWRDGRLLSSARPPVQAPPTVVAVTSAPTLRASPSFLAVGQTAVLSATGFAGPVRYTAYSSEVTISGDDVWADAPGYYVIAATFGDEMAFADITVGDVQPQPPASQSSGAGPTPAAPSGGLSVLTPVIAQGQILQASVPVPAGGVFWWLTSLDTGRAYPLLASSAGSIDEAVPAFVPPGSYTLKAQETLQTPAGTTYAAAVTVTAGAGTATISGMTPFDVYNWQDVLPLFQEGIEGQGETIALFETSDPSLADLQQFDSAMGLPAANLVTIAPMGDPGMTSDLDEADLDVEWAHAMAPGATIVVYVYSRLSEMLGGLADATLDALHSQDAAISISYGWPNANPVHLVTDVAFADAANEGLGIFASSGDHGQAAVLNMDWPSTDGDVVSVGGVQYDASGDPAYWYSDYDAGGVLWAGGYGRTLGLAPDWQAALGLGSGRMIPDVSDLATNAVMVLDGGATTAGGTSLASPMWAATWALCTQLYARDHDGARLAEPAGRAIYAIAASGALPAFSQGYDARTGFGPPDVANLARDLDALP